MMSDVYMMGALMGAPMGLLVLCAAAVLGGIAFFRGCRMITFDSDVQSKKVLEELKRHRPYRCPSTTMVGSKLLPRGPIFCLAYCGYVVPCANKMEVYVFCGDALRRKIMEAAESCGDSGEEEGGAEEEGTKGEEKPSPREAPSTTVKITEYRIGPSLQWPEYRKVAKKLVLAPPSPGSDQDRILGVIEDMFVKSRNRNLACIVYGPPGTGKSTLAPLLASRLNGVVCHFNPTAVGESLSCLYDEVSPTREQPMIVLQDEYDVMVRNIHGGRVATSHKARTSVTDKCSHNSHCDEVKTYPNMIVLRTTNTPKRVLEDTTDPSYVRRGRIDAYFRCMTRPDFVTAYHEDEDP